MYYVLDLHRSNRSENTPSLGQPKGNTSKEAMRLLYHSLAGRRSECQAGGGDGGVIMSVCPKAGVRLCI